jgi:hypothetical protein
MTFLSRMLFLSTILLVGAKASAQAQTFCRTYSSPAGGMDWFTKGQADSFGNFLATGTFTSPSGDRQMGLVNLQADGSVIWATAFGDTLVLDHAGGMFRLPNDKMFVMGSTGNGPNSAYLACLDDLGQLLWADTFGITTSNPPFGTTLASIP